MTIWSGLGKLQHISICNSCARGRPPETLGWDDFKRAHNYPSGQPLSHKSQKTHKNLTSCCHRMTGGENGLLWKRMDNVKVRGNADKPWAQRGKKVAAEESLKSEEMATGARYGKWASYGDFWRRCIFNRPQTLTLTCRCPRLSGTCHGWGPLNMTHEYTIQMDVHFLAAKRNKMSS